MTTVHVEIEMGPNDTLSDALREHCPASEASLVAWLYSQPDPMLRVAKLLQDLAGALKGPVRPVRVTFDFKPGAEPKVTVERA